MPEFRSTVIVTLLILMLTRAFWPGSTHDVLKQKPTTNLYIAIIEGKGPPSP